MSEMVAETSEASKAMINKAKVLPVKTTRARVRACVAKSAPAPAPAEFAI